MSLTDEPNSTVVRRAHDHRRHRSSVARAGAAGLRDRATRRVIDLTQRLIEITDERNALADEVRPAAHRVAGACRHDRLHRRLPQLQAGGAARRREASPAAMTGDPGVLLAITVYNGRGFVPRCLALGAAHRPADSRPRRARPRRRQSRARLQRGARGAVRRARRRLLPHAPQPRHRPQREPRAAGGPRRRATTTSSSPTRDVVYPRQPPRRDARRSPTPTSGSAR